MEDSIGELYYLHVFSRGDKKVAYMVKPTSELYTLPEVKIDEKNKVRAVIQPTETDEYARIKKQW